MIETLNGMHETVNYKENTNLRLYNNTDYEEYPMHWHTPLEIIMPLENHYIVEHNNVQLALREHDILIICPGILHRLLASEGRRIIFQAEVPSVLHIKELEAVLSLLSPVVYITPEAFPEVHPRIHDLILDICREYRDSQTLCEASIYSKLIEILVTVGRNHANNRNRFGAGQVKQKEYIETFMQICNYISAHCTEDLSLEQIADLSGFSKYHFSRLFKQFANVTFYKYLNQKRIEIAEQLLIDPSISITDVSMQSGFSSLSSFIRMFKIIKGCTPSAFRTLYTS